MSSYILCQTKKAEKPYYIENISTNIYSIEELCYYLYHNLYLIDHSIINEGLCSWIEEELELPRLASKLRPHLGKFACAEDILYPVFKEINYLTYEELKGLNARLGVYNGEEYVVREKKKGDALMENGMYVNAIRVYQGLLQREDLMKDKEPLLESTEHNLGCAYSYLFQMEKALEFFWKAYQRREKDEALKTYLLAYRSVRTPGEYEEKIKELSVPEKVQGDIAEALAAFSEKADKKVEADQLDMLLESCIREYHRSTGA